MREWRNPAFLFIFMANIIITTLSQQSYIFDATEMPMSDAEAFCSFNYGTNLASIHNDSQMADALSACASCWIGANDIDEEGVFRWTDGTPFNYGWNISGGGFPWQPGEPNDASGSEDCVEIRSRVWNDISCPYQKAILCNYPSPNPVINDDINNIRYTVFGQSVGAMDTLDNIHIEFDFIVYTYDEHSSTNILHIGSNMSRSYPSIDIYGPTAELHVSFSRIGNNNQHINYSPIQLNRWNHITLDITQTALSVSLNHSNIYNASNVSSHSILKQQPIYISNPWNVAMDGALRDLKITTNNAYLSPFNYLCDFHNRFSIFNGNWTVDPSTCWVTQNNNECNVSNVLFGNKDIPSLQWTDYKIELVLDILKWSCHNYNSSVGIFFISDSVSSEHNHEYHLDITSTVIDPDPTYPLVMNGIRFSEMSNSTISILWQDSYDYMDCYMYDRYHYGFYDYYDIYEESYFDYTLRIEAISGTFTVSVYTGDNYLLWTQSHDAFVYGSIGLKTENTRAIFKRFRIMFSDNNTRITSDPTRSPTEQTLPPTALPTEESQSPTYIPSINPTIYVMLNATNDWSLGPTNASAVISSITSNRIMHTGNIYQMVLVILGVLCCFILVCICVIGVLWWRRYSKNPRKMIEMNKIKSVDSNEKTVIPPSDNVHVSQVSVTGGCVGEGLSSFGPHFPQQRGEGVARIRSVERMIAMNPTLGAPKHRIHYSESSTLSLDSLKEDADAVTTSGN